MKSFINTSTSPLLFFLMLGCATPLLSSGQNYSKAGIVEREALIVYGLVGKHGFRPDTGMLKKVHVDGKGNRIIQFQAGWAEDYFQLGIFPYDDRIRLEAYLAAVVNKPNWYLFNDYYIVEGASHLEEEQFYRYIQHSLEFERMTPLLIGSELRFQNKHYVWTENRLVGKFWKIRAEWEHFIVPYKFRFFQVVSPETLIYDQYNVYVLKRIISLEEIDRPFAPNDKAQIVTGQIPMYESKWTGN